MRALVNRPICPLMTRPSRQCERGDEALSGMVLDLLEETLPGWYRVRTPYRYEGYAPAEDLLLGEAHAARWAALPKQVVLKGLCDVLSGPAVERIEKSVLKEVYFLDTVPPKAGVACDKIKYLSVAHMFAEAIERIYEEVSVSKLFV